MHNKRAQNVIRPKDENFSPFLIWEHSEFRGLLTEEICFHCVFGRDAFYEPGFQIFAISLWPFALRKCTVDSIIKALKGLAHENQFVTEKDIYEWPLMYLILR